MVSRTHSRDCLGLSLGLLFIGCRSLGMLRKLSVPRFPQNADNAIQLSHRVVGRIKWMNVCKTVLTLLGT